MLVNEYHVQKLERFAMAKYGLKHIAWYEYCIWDFVFLATGKRESGQHIKEKGTIYWGGQYTVFNSNWGQAQQLGGQLPPCLYIKRGPVKQRSNHSINQSTNQSINPLSSSVSSCLVSFSPIQYREPNWALI